MLEIRSEVKHPELDKIIGHISDALPEIHAVEEPGPEYDDLKIDTSFLSAPAPMKKSVYSDKTRESDDDLFEGEVFMKKPDGQDKLRWSLILTII